MRISFNASFLDPTTIESFIKALGNDIDELDLISSEALSEDDHARTREHIVNLRRDLINYLATIGHPTSLMDRQTHRIANVTKS